jgi:WD40 repeat protein
MGLGRYYPTTFHFCMFSNLSARPDSEFEVLSVLMEHSQDVKSVRWHPTKEILASASYDDTIKLYADDPDDDWYSFATLKGHTSTVWSLAWSPDGDYLASSSDDLTVRIWARLSETVWETVLILTGHTRTVFSIDWGKGSQSSNSLGWLASTGSDGQILVWDIIKPSGDSNLNGSNLPSSRLLSKLQDAHDVHDVNCIAWCPRSGFENTLATAGDDGNINIWRISV